MAYRIRRRMSRRERRVLLAVGAVVAFAAVKGGHGVSGIIPVSVAAPPGATTVSANEQLGEQMAAGYGWTGAQWTCLNWLWTRESNWETTATNPQSGAYGIPQSLPPGKMAAARRGLANRPGHADQVGPGLHPGHLRHAMRRVEPRNARRLVLASANRPGPRPGRNTK